MLIMVAPIKVNIPITLPVVESALSSQDRFSWQETQTGTAMILKQGRRRFREDTKCVSISAKEER